MKRDLLESVRDKAVRRWGLVLDGAQEWTPTGYVGFWRQGVRQVVLKIPDPDMGEADSHRALKHFAAGMVEMIDQAEGAILLERLLPGETLTGLVLQGRDDWATEIVCDIAAALMRPGAPQGFPTIEDWGQAFARHRLAGRGGIAPGLLDRAEGVFFDLAGSQAEPILLHGDLHHDNILHDAKRGWLAIDPKGVIGEPAYEMGAMLRNPTHNPARHARADILERRVALIGERQGFERKRLLGWHFAQAVLSAVWCIESPVIFRLAH